MNRKLKLFGNQSILIEWDDLISELVLLDILKTQRGVELSLAGRIEFVQNSYNNLLIHLIDDVNEKDISKVEEVLENEVSDFKIKDRRLWQIPVCYEDEFSLDLNELSIKKGISKEDIIRLHSSARYLIYFMGFLPGFCYLGGLNEQLYQNRIGVPRNSVPKGSVGIGGRQTGVYPVESPGGWNIIGNTPIDLLKISSSDNRSFRAGDFIEFIPITKNQYSFIQKEVEKENYKLKSLPC